MSWIVIGSKRWPNANLILIWNVKVSLSQKYRSWNPTNSLQVYRHRICLLFKYRYLKSWKMCYQCTIIQFDCSLRVPFRIPVLEVLKMRDRYTIIQFVCSWSTGRKEIVIIFEKKIYTLIFFFQFYTLRKNHYVYQIYLSKYESTGMSPELQF